MVTSSDLTATFRELQKEYPDMEEAFPGLEIDKDELEAFFWEGPLDIFRAPPHTVFGAALLMGIMIGMRR